MNVVISESGEAVSVEVQLYRDGKDGVDGVNGIDGAVGPVGPQGPIGLTGAQGPAGVPPTSTLKNTNTITFDSSIGDYYGSVAAPRTGTLTFDTTGAVRGGQAVVYYNNSTLAIPTTWMTFGSFFPGQINKLYFERDGEGNVTCNIVNSGVDTGIPSTVGALTITNDVPSTSVKFVFATPTDAYSASANLDILIYNGPLGSETLFATILKASSNKSIVGANMEITGVPITGGTTYQFSIKARDEAGNVSAAFSLNTIHTPPVASYVILDNVNSAISAAFTYTGGTPATIASNTTNAFLKYNTTKPNAFSVKVFIKDVYTKDFWIGLDDSSANTDIYSTWNLVLAVDSTYGVKVGSTPVNPDAGATTLVANTTNYLRLARNSGTSAVLLYYFNGTTEVLLHTFAAQSAGIYFKGYMQSSNRRFYDLQIQ